ncbi:hypothetical protein ANAPC5_01261 [Anaplasma phagocytophilum]|nr:hypothetical protein ANAPC5_01261 [Anaplasma phagocytophilum]
MGLAQTTHMMYDLHSTHNVVSGHRHNDQAGGNICCDYVFEICLCVRTDCYEISDEITRTENLCFTFDLAGQLLNPSKGRTEIKTIISEMS